MRKKKFNFHSIQEAVIVGDVARGMLRINDVLENRQDGHQTSMVEIEGMIKIQPISILIDPSARLSYVSPRIVEICKLVPEKFDNPWLVQLATGTKRKVTSYVKGCEILMNDFNAHVDLNILKLGSYDMLIGMYWIEKQRVMLNCFENLYMHR